MADNKPIIEGIEQGSIGEELGIEKGDTLMTVNGQRPRDLIDYRFMCAEEDLELEIMKNNGEIWSCDIQKDYDQDLGLLFAGDTFDGMHSCVNKCIFCFVDQMPADMRESLYVKDDDYRLSFLHGNFITLTNINRQEMERIIKMRISPLYISVHCTNPRLREHMLGCKRAGRIMEQLSILAEAGIEMHIQIVLCPGINDGEELERSIRDLTALYPRVQSIAIVPVGLTRYRENMQALRKFNTREAGIVIDTIHLHQKRFLEKYGTPLVYLGDEFYVLAGRDFPETQYYGEFPQAENGVGLVRLFYDSFEEERSRIPDRLENKKRVALVTGVSGEKVLKPIAEDLNKTGNLDVEIVGVFNEFFGGHVTVAGLLTGRDVLKTLKEQIPFDLILLPSVMCKRDEPVFLDGKTPADLERELGVPVRVIDVDSGAGELIRAITG
ncbi:MAG: DUF512 domain-containing protein [Firmicutes bacterium HGW-Firmicutes-14]|nr:MAG: DUF512 domain-containing protein [Firmicutes bacterium HGW-Firmicutes-14]